MKDLLLHSISYATENGHVRLQATTDGETFVLELNRSEVDKLAYLLRVHSPKTVERKRPPIHFCDGTRHGA